MIIFFNNHIGANNWNMGLYRACDNGHLNIVNLMIELGANDWDGGLCYACMGGNLNIAKLMIEKGANDCYYCKRLIQSH